MVWEESRSPSTVGKGGKVSIGQTVGVFELPKKVPFPPSSSTATTSYTNDHPLKWRGKQGHMTLVFVDGVLQLLSPYRRRCRLHSSELPTIFLLRDIKGCLVLKRLLTLPGCRQFHNEQNSQRQPLRLLNRKQTRTEQPPSAAGRLATAIGSSAAQNGLKGGALRTVNR